MTPDEQDQARADDDGMATVPAGRAYRKGTKVESTKRTGRRRCRHCGMAASEARAYGEPICNQQGKVGGHSYIDPPERGEVVGYDDDLLLPLIAWETDVGPEACEADEFEVIAA